MSKAYCIIQARTGSTRLPGKVLMDIGGRPMLARVVERCREAKSLEGVVVATSVLPGDDPIAELAEASGWLCVRGSEDDVLDRYHQAATAVDADEIVRVTADCPLIDPAIIDLVLGTLRESGADYAANTVAPRTYPRGLDTEAFTRAALETAWREAEAEAQREHVTPFLWGQPARFSLARVAAPVDHSAYRWTVDTEADLDLVRRIFSELPTPLASLDEALAVLERHPEWTTLNQHVEQKSVV